MALFRRGPSLLPASQLPEGFVYPPELTGFITDTSLRQWEWLVGERLRRAATRLWVHHPRELVPVAVRRGTSYVVCLDASLDPEGDGYDVVTIDAVTAGAAPVQHVPNLTVWVEEALREQAQPPPPEPTGPREPDGSPAAAAPGDPADPADPADRWRDEAAREDPYLAEGHPAEPSGWTPRATGECRCVHHLGPFALTQVPWGHAAPPGLAPRTVADLVMAADIVVIPDHPGPSVTYGRRELPVGPFHWRVELTDAARLHYDADGRVAMDEWLMRNPGVGFVTWVQREAELVRDLHLQAPELCHDGVLTLVARALLDDRLRRRR